MGPANAGNLEAKSGWGEVETIEGHYHVPRDCGDAYDTPSGQGILLLQTRDGETRYVEMASGICAFISPDWAHRSITIGTEPPVFKWFC
jgi:glucose-6-phosphate isomerase